MRAKTLKPLLLSMRRNIVNGSIVLPRSIFDCIKLSYTLLAIPCGFGGSLVLSSCMLGISASPLSKLSYSFSSFGLILFMMPSLYGDIDSLKNFASDSVRSILFSAILTSLCLLSYLDQFLLSLISVLNLDEKSSLSVRYA